MHKRHPTNTHNSHTNEWLGTDKRTARSGIRFAELVSGFNLLCYKLRSHKPKKKKSSIAPVAFLSEGQILYMRTPTI